jgi:hypothetical protein
VARKRLNEGPDSESAERCRVETGPGASKASANYVQARTGWAPLQPCRNLPARMWQHTSRTIYGSSSVEKVPADGLNISRDDHEVRSTPIALPAIGRGKYQRFMVHFRGVIVDHRRGLGAEVARFRVEIESADGVGTVSASELHAAFDALDSVKFHCLNCSPRMSRGESTIGTMVMRERISPDWPRRAASEPRSAWTAHGGGPCASLMSQTSFRQAVVLLKHLAQAVVRQGDHGVVVDAGHGVGGDHGVDDGLFGSLYGGQEQWIEAVVG